MLKFYWERHTKEGIIIKLMVVQALEKKQAEGGRWRVQGAVVVENSTR